MGEEKSVKATASYGVDTNWYADSIATEHVTGDLDKLVVKDTYHGGDQIYIASGLGMRIKHIGHSTIRTPYRNLKLNHILHVPRSSRNLASIHWITSDNNVSLSFILTSSSLRIGSWGELFFKAGLKGVFIPFLTARLAPVMLSSSSVSISYPSQGGMQGSVTLHHS
jgi:hypothetical protein